MWQRVKAFCFGSATIAWSYFLVIAGLTLQIADLSASYLNDPTVQAALQTIFGSDPKTVGRILLAISIVNILARMRSLRLRP